MSLTATCHPDRRLQSHSWQNYHFQVFWNLKSHPANLSDWSEHSSCRPLEACGRQRVEGVRGGNFQPFASPWSSKALQKPVSPLPWAWCPGWPSAAASHQGYDYRMEGPCPYGTGCHRHGTFSEESERVSRAYHPELCLAAWHSGDFPGNFCGKHLTLCLGHTLRLTAPAGLTQTLLLQVC